MAVLVLRTEPHDVLDAGAVVPAAVEDDDLAACGEVRQVALQVHLRLFAFGRSGKRHDTKHARTDTLADRSNRPALACAVATLENNDDAQALVFDPGLELAQLSLEAAHLLRVGFVAHSPV